ncbi:kininogen-1 isoform X2 [Pseudophryne corroboree]|uniref:kininogen-1 isoform X2 n=1 Tax=Pseudophryne corroboree TaxID=495146 RepID=UPI0030820320
MGHLLVLLLCSYIVLGSATQVPTTDADCNDVNTFEAVDEALRSYNNAKGEGNQFVLHRITDAKLKDEGDGQMHYFVEHEIHEGSCGVKSGKTWQECAFLASKADRGKCSAHVIVNKELKVRSVVSQNCSSTKDSFPVEPPVTAVHHQCLGCPQPIDLNNEELLHFVHSTIEKMNTEGSHPFYFDFETIVNATNQVVRGWNYNINYLIRQTNCSKTNFTSKHFAECQIDKNGESGECAVQLSITSNGQVNDLQMECRSKTGVCLNCPVPVDSQDPEILSLLVQVMDEYNSNSSHIEELYSISSVQYATKKGFYRLLYELTFTIKPTNCSKPNYTILADECDFIPDADHQSCSTEISVTEEMMKVLSAPECHQARNFSLRIGGFSPFRKASKNIKNNIVKPSKSLKPLQQSRENRHGHNNKEQKHGKKEKKDKRKPKHDHKDVDTSEEPEGTINKSTQDFGNSHELPVHTIHQEVSSNSRCPGKVWQPITLIPEMPTVKTFSIDDLAFAVDDLTPLSGQDTEKNEPDLQKEISLFNDEDLLD